MRGVLVVAFLCILSFGFAVIRACQVLHPQVVTAFHVDCGPRLVWRLRDWHRFEPRGEWTKESNCILVGPQILFHGEWP